MRPDRLSAKTLERDGISLAYVDAGGSGLPVVFQHGLCGDRGQVTEAFPDAAELRMLSLECRGHGQSHPGPFEGLSIAGFADDVLAMMDAEGIDRAVIGGISMGAAIALRIAVRHAERVRALVLVRPAWGPEAAPQNMAPNAEVGRLLRHYDPDQARRIFEQSPTSRGLRAQSPDNHASLLGFFRRVPQAVTSALLTQISADGPGVSAADLEALRLPVLVLGTEDDAIHPMALAEGLAHTIPGARFERLPAKGRDKPAHIAALHAALTQFCKDL